MGSKLTDDGASLVEEKANFAGVVEALLLSGHLSTKRGDYQTACTIYGYAYETCVIEDLRVTLRGKVLSVYCTAAKKGKFLEAALEITGLSLQLAETNQHAFTNHQLASILTIHSALLRKTGR